MEPFNWRADPVNQYFQPPSGQEPRRIDPVTGTLTFNPRDNLVTLIAYARGAETFTDLNGNGTHDDGEPFVDTTEPFVDANDNGTWDPGEAFVDTNGNGRWDGKNGTFDSDTWIWAQERILWTGIPNVPSTSPGLSRSSGWWECLRRSLRWAPERPWWLRPIPGSTRLRRMMSPTDAAFSVLRQFWWRSIQVCFSCRAFARPIPASRGRHHSSISTS